MPDPDETTLNLTLPIQEAIVVLTALNDALENPENTAGYKRTANNLALQLFQLMVDTWPEWSRQPLDDIDEDGYFTGQSH